MMRVLKNTTKNPDSAYQRFNELVTRHRQLQLNERGGEQPIAPVTAINEQQPFLPYTSMSFAPADMHRQRSEGSPRSRSRIDPASKSTNRKTLMKKTKQLPQSPNIRTEALQQKINAAHPDENEERGRESSLNDETFFSTGNVNGSNGDERRVASVSFQSTPPKSIKSSLKLAHTSRLSTPADSRAAKGSHRVNFETTSTPLTTNTSRKRGRILTTSPIISHEIQPHLSWPETAMDPSPAKRPSRVRKTTERYTPSTSRRHRSFGVAPPFKEPIPRSAIRQTARDESSRISLDDRWAEVTR